MIHSENHTVSLCKIMVHSRNHTIRIGNRTDPLWGLWNLDLRATRTHLKKSRDLVWKSCSLGCVVPTRASFFFVAVFFCEMRVLCSTGSTEFRTHQHFLGVNVNPQFSNFLFGTNWRRSTRNDAFGVAFSFDWKNQNGLSVIFRCGLGVCLFFLYKQLVSEGLRCTHIFITKTVCYQKQSLSIMFIDRVVYC